MEITQKQSTGGGGKLGLAPKGGWTITSRWEKRQGTKNQKKRVQTKNAAPTGASIAKRRTKVSYVLEKCKVPRGSDNNKSGEKNRRKKDRGIKGPIAGGGIRTLGRKKIAKSIRVVGQ